MYAALSKTMSFPEPCPALTGISRIAHAELPNSPQDRMSALNLPRSNFDVPTLCELFGSCGAVYESQVGKGPRKLIQYSGLHRGL